MSSSFLYYSHSPPPDIIRLSLNDIEPIMANNSTKDPRGDIFADSGKEILDRPKDNELCEPAVELGTVDDAVFGEQQEGGPNYRNVRSYVMRIMSGELLTLAL